jgi:hypothetical protein
VFSEEGEQGDVWSETHHSVAHELQDLVAVTLADLRQPLKIDHAEILESLHAHSLAIAFALTHGPI